MALFLLVINALTLNLYMNVCVMETIACAMCGYGKYQLTNRVRYGVVDYTVEGSGMGVISGA